MSIKQLTLFATISLTCFCTSKVDISTPKTVVSRRFRSELDTFYKDNSTNINYIVRTFYQFVDKTTQKTISLKTDVYNNKSEEEFTEFTIFVSDSFEVQSTNFTDSTFEKFLKDAKTVLKNADKRLSFDFGHSFKSKDIEIKSGCKITSFNQGHTYLFFPPSDRHKSILININTSEIDSMENCFRRYLEERK